MNSAPKRARDLPASTFNTPYTNRSELDGEWGGGSVFGSDGGAPLNEVGRPIYGTLDGGKGALEMISGHQW